MECLAHTGVTISVRDRVDGAIYRVDFMSQFGAPVLSTVPSAGMRQVRNLSINDRSLSSHDQSPPEGTVPLE